jgi:hypothetical protein
MNTNLRKNLNGGNLTPSLLTLNNLNWNNKKGETLNQRTLNGGYTLTTVWTKILALFQYTCFPLI